MVSGIFSIISYLYLHITAANLASLAGYAPSFRYINYLISLLIGGTKQAIPNGDNRHVIIAITSGTLK